MKKSEKKSIFLSCELNDETFKKIFSDKPHIIIDEGKKEHIANYHGTYGRIGDSIDKSWAEYYKLSTRKDLTVLNVIAVAKQYTLEVTINKETILKKWSKDHF
jgi:hypothetical protein